MRSRNGLKSSTNHSRRDSVDLTFKPRGMKITLSAQDMLNNREFQEFSNSVIAIPPTAFFKSDMQGSRSGI